MTVEVVVEELVSLRDLLKLSPKMIKCISVKNRWFYFNEYGMDSTVYVTGTFSQVLYPSHVGVDGTDKIVAKKKSGVPVVLVGRYDLVYNAVKKHLEENPE